MTKTPESVSQSNLPQSVSKSKSPKKSKAKKDLLSCCTGGGEDIELLGRGKRLLLYRFFSFEDKMFLRTNSY